MATTVRARMCCIELWRLGFRSAYHPRSTQYLEQNHIVGTHSIRDQQTKEYNCRLELGKGDPIEAHNVDVGAAWAECFSKLPDQAKMGNNPSF